MELKNIPIWRELATMLNGSDNFLVCFLTAGPYEVLTYNHSESWSVGDAIESPPDDVIS